jgi:hypothetical protein
MMMMMVLLPILWSARKWERNVVFGIFAEMLGCLLMWDGGTDRRDDRTGYKCRLYILYIIICLFAYLSFVLSQEGWTIFMLRHTAMHELVATWPAVLSIMAKYSATDLIAKVDNQAHHVSLNSANPKTTQVMPLFLFRLFYRENINAGRWTGMHGFPVDKVTIHAIDGWT